MDSRDRGGAGACAACLGFAYPTLPRALQKNAVRTQLNKLNISFIGPYGMTFELRAL